MKEKLDVNYISSVSCWDSGGGNMIDVVELNNGYVLAITDEYVVLYDNIDSLYNGGKDGEIKVIDISKLS